MTRLRALLVDLDPATHCVSHLLALAAILSEFPGDDEVVIVAGEQRLLLGQRVMACDELSVTIRRALSLSASDASLDA